MKIGVVFPQTEFGNDPGLIKAYAQLAEEVGYSHILAYDHVLGAEPRPGWQGPYTHETSFHEPLVMFAFMAGVTTSIEFVTGILILPQRQTAVVAKQVSTLDILSGGRVRFGVGVGWNDVEYTALNQDFSTRGKRMEEQIAVLRELWQKPLVTFNGRWHNIPAAGIKPLPHQAHIPIWFGGHAEAVLQRAAKMGDGWFPNYYKPADAVPWLEKLDGYLADNGRSRADFGVEARMSFGKNGTDPEGWHAHVQAWQETGVTHLTLNTMGIGFQSPQEHLNAIQIFAETILG